MKNIPSKVLTMLLAAVLFAGAFPVFAPNIPHTQNAIWIEDADPPYWAVNLTTANPLHTVGFKFNITVWLDMETVVSPAVGVDTWQVKLFYPTAYLDALRAGYTWGGKSEFFKDVGTVPVTPVIDDVSGFVWHSETCAPNYVTVPRTGSLFWIEFIVTKVPGKNEVLEGIFDLINADTVVADNEGNKYPPNPISRENAYYRFEWQPPPNPHMSVEHDGFYGVPPTSPGPSDVWPLYWGPYPPSAVGSAFDAKIYIEDLAAAWGLTNASFCLSYNSTVLSLTNLILNTADWDVASKSSLTAIVKGANRLVALQSPTDYGWDWDVTGLTAHSANPSPGNIYGVTALGLLDAYELTGDTAYFDAAKAVADYLMSLGNETYHYQFDLEFLIEFAKISGDTTYKHFASQVWTWIKTNMPEFADGVTLYNWYYNTRYPGSHGGAVWGTGDWAIAALELGDTAWAKDMANVIADNYTKIVLGTDPYGFEYVGWGKALLAFQAVDPTAYAAEISDIVGKLTPLQQTDGSFSGWVQDEAYVTMGLVAVGQIEMAKKAAKWLVINQGYDTIVGGWKLPDGKEYSEVTSEAIQAIYDVLQAGEICFFVETSKQLSGKVPIATANFTILLQQNCPPYPMGYYDFSKLTFQQVKLYDHVMEIPTATPENGEVRILALVQLPLPWLEVSPKDTVLAPYGEYAIGEEFEVKIVIKNLHFAWYLVSYQFRLTYCPELLEVVEVTEGPFLQDERWNLHGTFFTSGIDSDEIFGPHVYAGGILLPNWTTGEYDQTIWPQAPGPDVPDLDPPVDPVLATIRFKAIKQEFCFEAPNLTCALNILPFWMPENCHFGDKDGNYIPTDTPKIVNGTYTICGSFMVGRLIDVYGGAVNRGYGLQYGTPSAFPAPYGGQGVGGDMDLVIPQSVVYLLANVTYNHWPVQSKDVGFEIEGPYYQEGWKKTDPQTWRPKDSPPFHIRKYTNRTDENGVTWIKFQMPWPCDNPEDYFGKYRVTATVDICGVVVTDVLWFDYYYLVEITKVTTDKYAYAHGESVKVTVEYRTKAQQKYPVLFAIVLQDELETHVSATTKELLVGGAKFCSWKTETFTVELPVEKWAFAGYAHIYVSAFDKDPTEGGAPWCPTFGLGWPPGATLPEILILPY